MKRFAFIVIIALQWTSVTGQPRHITVAADGSGEFTSVQEAVNSVRAYTIWILGSGFTAENITFENNAEQLGPGCRRACRCRHGGLPHVRDTGQPGYSSYSQPGEQAVLRGVLY